MSDIIGRIQQKLAYLREHEDYDVTDADVPRRTQVHTSSMYHYQLSAPADEARIAAFEAQHEIQFPDDYRRFLLEVGTGGHGPGYYDFYSPFDETLTLPSGEVRSLTCRYRGTLRYPFPFYDPVSVAAVDTLMATVDELYGRKGVEDVFMAGHLNIAYSGCQCWHLLVISGKARGQIWYCDTAYSPVMLSGGRFVPETEATPADAVRVNFTVWYETWLNQEIATAQNHWQKRGRHVPPPANYQG